MFCAQGSIILLPARVDTLPLASLITRCSRSSGKYYFPFFISDNGFGTHKLRVAAISLCIYRAPFSLIRLAGNTGERPGGKVDLSNKTGKTGSGINNISLAVYGHAADIIWQNIFPIGCFESSDR